MLDLFGKPEDNFCRDEAHIFICYFRSKNPISYKFEEYDELIMDAIQEDMSIPKEPRPKKVKPPGRNVVWVHRASFSLVKLCIGTLWLNELYHCLLSMPKF